MGGKPFLEGTPKATSLRGGRAGGRKVQGSTSPSVIPGFHRDSYLDVYSTSACAESFTEERRVKKNKQTNKKEKHQQKKSLPDLKHKASKHPLLVNLWLLTITMHCNVVQKSDSEITRLLINGSIQGV